MSLPESYLRVRFDQPARAELNLASLAGRLPGPLPGLLPAILAQVPDPDTALNTLERFTEAASPAAAAASTEGGASPRVMSAVAERPVLLHYLLALFSHSSTLTKSLVAEPELFLWLARDRALDRLKTPEDLLESYARFEVVAGEADPSSVMARFKRREYLRIALRDILRLSHLTETTHELSALADMLLVKALELASRNLERRTGWPHATDEQGRAVRARFAIVSLGKLGGDELNYDSDVDLLFLFDGEGKTAGGSSEVELVAGEFFLRLGQEVMRLVAGVNPEGRVYRTDLRLRPGGGEGDLVVSLPAALDYYRSRAREWELQMLLKARHSAGDETLVREFERQVEPLLYSPDDPATVVEAVFEARRQMDRKLAQSAGKGMDVKLAPGGIRDIEFLVQCLQRLHGGVDRWVRSRGTLLGLQRLADKGYLSSRDHHELAAAYQFFRLVEHRLQLDQGQQTHSVPSDRTAFALLARRCRVESFGAETEGDNPEEDFQRNLDEHARRVRTIYSRVLERGALELDAESFRLVTPAEETAPHALEHAPLLRKLRQRSEAVYRAALEAEPADHARKPFERFLASALESETAFDTLSQTPEALSGVAAVLGWSRPIGELLIRHPEGAEWITGAESGDGDQNLLGFGDKQRGAAWAGPADLKASISMGLPRAEFLSLLRKTHSSKILQWGIQALAHRQSLDETLAEYSRLAHDVLLSVWVANEVIISGPEIAIISLGRFAGNELDLGSDLDLVFIAADEEVGRASRPVVERFVNALSAHVREGSLYQVDARLRPEGSAGELVQTKKGILEYFRTRAKVWEAAAYLKAAPLHAGHRGFGVRCCSQIAKVLKERFSDREEVRDELLAMRTRLETEAAGANGVYGADDFKAGPGGFYDIEFILAMCSFRTGSLREGGKSVWKRIADFQEAGTLDEDAAATLTESATVYRTVDHSIRLATGSSSPGLPAGKRGEIAAELAGRRLGRPLSAATLATELAEHRQRVRAVYNKIFEV